MHDCGRSRTVSLVVSFYRSTPLHFFQLCYTSRVLLPLRFMISHRCHAPYHDCNMPRQVVMSIAVYLVRVLMSVERHLPLWYFKMYLIFPNPIVFSCLWARLSADFCALEVYCIVCLHSVSLVDFLRMMTGQIGDKQRSVSPFLILYISDIASDSWKYCWNVLAQDPALWACRD